MKPMFLQTQFSLAGRLPTLFTITLLILFAPLLTRAQGLIAEDAKPCKTIVIGFVGGMRSPEDLTQGVVQIGNRLRSLDQSNLQVNVYRHWHWRRVYQEIYQSIDQDRNESLSEEEIRRAPAIVIYGHSLGGWAVIKLSRKLERKNIPVELTVQIDSVGTGDEVIPDNVRSAANYYQRTRLLLRGEKRIRAEDAKKTIVEGNILIRDVGHEALAEQAEISDFITDKVRRLCKDAVATSDARRIATHTAEASINSSGRVR